MKKLLTMTLTLLLVLGLTACGQTTQGNSAGSKAAAPAVGEKTAAGETNQPF